MDILRKTLLLFIIALLCHGSDHCAVLRAHQANDGLWYDSNGLDVLGSLFALTTLDASSAPENLAAAQRARAAIHLNCKENDSLLGTLPFVLASQSDVLFNLSAFHDNEGWKQEQGAAPDWASTLLMLLLAPATDYTEQDCLFLLKEAPSNNTRYSLLLLYSYLRHDLQPPEDLLRKLEANNDSYGYFEQALALYSLAKLARWDEALNLREHLLASQLPESGWGEANGLPFDLVTTSLVIQALDCFHVHENTLTPDISLSENTTNLEDDNGSTLITTVVSNIGSVSADTFQLFATALTSSAVLPLAKTSISYLPPGKSQRVSLHLTLPDDCTAILLEADPTGTTRDAQRANNSVVVTLAEQLSPPHLSEMLFDWRKPIYPYYLNPGFGAIASISILFPTLPTSLVWKWLCDGSIFSTGGMECPDPNQPLLITADCFPSVGRHTITLQITETNGETSNTMEASMDIQVLYNSYGLFCHPADRTANNANGTFAAREEIVFETFSSYPKATANVSIFNSSGAYLGNAAADMVHGRFRWNTESQPPGHYKAIAQFWDFDTMEMPFEAECLFDIAPTSTSSNLLIHSVTDKNTGFRFYEGLVSSPAVSLGWTTVANIPTPCLLSWEISDVNGHIVTQSAAPITIDTNLSSPRQWYLLELPDIAFEQVATYTLHVHMTTNNQILEASHSLEIARRPGIVVENKLYHPDGTDDETGVLQLPPSDGTATRVTDIVCISIQDESLATPYSFQCGASPLTMHDSPDNTVSITLDTITNALGNTISSGWLVCQTPYGFISGENNLTPDWSYGSTVAIPIHNGTACFTYTPQGETSGSFSLLIPIEIFPYENGCSFASRRIGIIEIHLTNPQ